MYELKVISESGRYWFQASSETRADLHLIEFEKLKLMPDAIKVALRQNLNVVEPGFKIDISGPNKFTFYLQSGYSFFGYHLSKSKLTAFRNQLIGVLNG